MALIPKVKYGAQTITSDPGYPLGKACNVGAPGDGTGTPWEEALVNDIWGLQQALLGAGGVSASGMPDKVGASDYLTALQNIVDNRAGALLAPVTAAVAGSDAANHAWTGTHSMANDMTFAAGKGIRFNPPKVVVENFPPVTSAGSSWKESGLLPGVFYCDQASQSFLMKLPVPVGAMLTGVAVIAAQGSAFSGTPLNNLNYKVFKVTPAIGSVNGSIAVVSNSTSAGGGDWSAIGSPSGFVPSHVRTDLDYFVIVVSSSAGAAPGSVDLVNTIQCVYETTYG
jgi:hypothetical protein